MIKLASHQKAVLVEYLVAEGMPDWSKGKLQHKVLAALAGISEEQAAAAYERAARCGYLSKPHEQH